jgi:hypothetical protein
MAAAMVPEQTGIDAERFCANCSAPLSGTHCPSCGQREVDLDRPFRDIAGEAMESFLSFDTRILRTLWPLIRRPGMLTVEYMAGRRVRYVHPFKLYFAFSVLLFLVLASIGYTVVHTNLTEDQVVTGVRIETSDEQEGEDPAAEEEGEPSLLGKMLNDLGELAENDPDRLNRLFTDRLAKSIILLVPVFAALLMVVYWRRRYIAHLVFSLHLHSFAFLALIVGIVFDFATGPREGTGPGNAVAVLVIGVYSFLALRRVYGQGRFLTIFKMIVLFIGYLVALFVTMIFTLALTVAAV